MKNTSNYLIAALVAIGGVAIVALPASACTGIRLTATDGTVISPARWKVPWIFNPT